MLRSLWNRFVGKREEAAIEHAVDRDRQETHDGHAHDHESFEDHQADRESEAHLGGGDPGPR